MNQVRNSHAKSGQFFANSFIVTDQEIVTFMIWKVKTNAEEAEPENLREKPRLPEEKPDEPSDPYIAREGVDIRELAEWEGQSSNQEDCKGQCIAKEEMCKAYSFDTLENKFTLFSAPQFSFQNAQITSGYHVSFCTSVKRRTTRTVDMSMRWILTNWSHR